MAAFDFRMKQQFFGAQGPSRTPITDFPALGRDHESSELRRVIRMGLPGLAGAGQVNGSVSVFQCARFPFRLENTHGSLGSGSGSRLKSAKNPGQARLASGGEKWLAAVHVADVIARRAPSPAP